MCWRTFVNRVIANTEKDKQKSKQKPILRGMSVNKAETNTEKDSRRSKQKRILCGRLKIKPGLIWKNGIKASMETEMPVEVYQQKVRV